jgi:hypothetical protein
MEFFGSFSPSPPFVPVSVSMLLDAQSMPASHATSGAKDSLVFPKTLEENLLFNPNIGNAAFFASSIITSAIFLLKALSSSADNFFGGFLSALTAFSTSSPDSVSAASVFFSSETYDFLKNFLTRAIRSPGLVSNYLI